VERYVGMAVRTPIFAGGLQQLQKLGGKLKAWYRRIPSKRKGRCSLRVLPRVQVGDRDSKRRISNSLLSM